MFYNELVVGNSVDIYIYIYICIYRYSFSIIGHYLSLSHKKLILVTITVECEKST